MKQMKNNPTDQEQEFKLGNIPSQTEAQPAFNCSLYPKKASQDACWEKSRLLLPHNFKILKWWTSYQTYLPEWVQVLHEKNVKLLLGQGGMKQFLANSQREVGPSRFHCRILTP